MREFVDARTPEIADEIWFVEHEPVLTLGKGADPTHVLDPGNIPIVRSDRGGQVTYHGPGQLLMYVLLDLTRLRFGPKTLVRKLEQIALLVLEEYGRQGQRIVGAPGVYVDGAKIAALGLRIRRGYSYHGLSFNVDPDLAPYERINPCGYAGLAATSLKQLGIAVDAHMVRTLLERFVLTTLYDAESD